MRNRIVKSVFTAPDIMIDPNKLKQPLPIAGLDQIDPFLLLHHMPTKSHEPGVNVLDVGPHPHRGFEPVTFVFKGEVEHNDSMGNHSVIGAGGVQWMIAGRGIVHSEGASKEQMAKEDRCNTLGFDFSWFFKSTFKFHPIFLLLILLLRS